jgi:hypothetical protein
MPQNPIRFASKERLTCYGVCNSGLIPQAPFHTASLCVTRKKTDDAEENKGKVTTVIDHVVEQRVSNLAQGLLTLGTMSGPLLTVLGLIPQAVIPLPPPTHPNSTNRHRFWRGSSS